MATDFLSHADYPEEEWPELVPVDAPNLPRLDPNQLPGWAGTYARAVAEATETPIELAVQEAETSESSE